MHQQAPPGAMRVFVGNIPYGATENLITEVLSRVGRVLDFEISHDSETGRPKGFGFADYADADSAESAIRNLDGYEVMGRKIRVSYSNKDSRGNDLGPTGYKPDGGQTAHSVGMPAMLPQMPGSVPPPLQSQGLPAPGQPGSMLPQLPAGVEVPPGLTCPDAISRTLATLPPAQLLDIISQMKGLVMSDPARATELLNRAPQLSYAIFQALLLLGLVDTSVLRTVVETATGVAGATPQPQMPTQPTPQQQSYPAYGGTPAQAQQPYAAPPPPPPQVAVPGMPPNKDELIQQVLALTDAQIDALPPEQNAQIRALRNQLLSRRSL
ncbi:hinge domain of cleavage stimulation factor subunit 2-domain-containing protein [Lineolata rhizophorae]|uniref:Hinge domain of cleavage stimulation factor subunit 2-domain-containing protein n=1 Tax=Lineolata rhizophorae TaxID=578093 RepID=A0A6A6P0T6_9PEZI|nr:hinge domain of cleavage stimulation factor subunit 2-domain-containing protein [Lineolata rhizophorae]